MEEFTRLQSRKTMKRFLTLIGLILTGCGQSESDTVDVPEQPLSRPTEQVSSVEQNDVDLARAKEAAKTQAREINEAMIRDDYSTVVEYSLSSVVKLNGGAEKMISTMARGSKEMKARGTSLQSISIGEPSELIALRSELFVVVPFEMEIKVPDGKLRASSFVIGISNDRGVNWKFVNGDLDLQTVKLVIPNLPSDLKIPLHQRPTFEPD